MNNYECKRCGVLIKQDENNFCSKCVERNYKDILLIKKIISERRISDVATISKSSGISIKVINILEKSNYLIFNKEK